MQNNFNPDSDVIKVCQGVIKTELLFWDNPNGAYEYECPFCNEIMKIRGDEQDPTMATFKHNISCIYYVAKDLLTGIK